MCWEQKCWQSKTEHSKTLGEILKCCLKRREVSALLFFSSPFTQLALETAILIQIKMFARSFDRHGLAGAAFGFLELFLLRSKMEKAPA